MGFNLTKSPQRKTAEDGKGFKSTPMMELYRVITTSLLTGDSFYESNNSRVSRIRELIREIAIMPRGMEFLAGLAVYTRDKMYLRTSPTILTAELFIHKLEGAQLVADRIWKRGDEFLEALAYLKVQNLKRPKQLLKAIAKKVNSLPVYNLIKYSSKGKSFSMRDALRLAHPIPVDAKQNAAFKYITQGKEKLSSSDLALLPEVTQLQEGDGLTWEQHISGKGSTKETWEEAVEKMGYMALLRNLRNLMEKKVSKKTIDKVAQKLSDPDEVKYSKQLPWRFLNAYTAVKESSGDDYAKRAFNKAIRKALDLSVVNVPVLQGDTLILVDVSGSMEAPISTKGTEPGLPRFKVGAILGAILSMAAKGETWVFATSCKKINFSPEDDTIDRVNKIYNIGVNHGTEIANALATATQGGNREFRRAIILTDMQSGDDVWTFVKSYMKHHPDFSCYCIDLAGYEISCLPVAEGCYQLAGFSDKIFNWIAEQEATSSSIVETICQLGKQVLENTYSKI